MGSERDKLWGLHWWMMGLLMLGSVINYLTRATRAVAAPSVLNDLDITNREREYVSDVRRLEIS